MKQLFLLIMALGIFFCISLAFAGEIQVNQNGEIRFVEPGWRSLTKAEMLAYENPGKEVPVDLYRITSKKVDFLHYILSEEYTKVVLFANGKLRIIAKQGKKCEPKLDWHIILLLTAALFMVIFNITSEKGGIPADADLSVSIVVSVVAGLLTCASVVLAAVVAFISFAALADILVTAFAAIFAFVPLFSIKKYKLSVVMFYLCIVAAIVI